MKSKRKLGQFAIISLVVLAVTVAIFVRKPDRRLRSAERTVVWGSENLNWLTRAITRNTERTVRQTAIANINLRDREGRTPMMFLAANRITSRSTIEAMVRAGASVNVRDNDGRTPLMFAALQNPTVSVTNALLNAKADINAKDNYGLTPLMLAAAQNSSVAVVNVLLKARANVNARDNEGRTALMYAARYNSNEAFVRALLNAKADINAKDNYGLTSLMFAAAKNSNISVIKTLLRAGVNINARDNDGHTALTYTASEQVKKALLNAGATASDNTPVLMWLSKRFEPNPKITAATISVQRSAMQAASRSSLSSMVSSALRILRSLRSFAENSPWLALCLLCAGLKILGTITRAIHQVFARLPFSRRHNTTNTGEQQRQYQNRDFRSGSSDYSSTGSRQSAGSSGWGSTSDHKRRGDNGDEYGSKGSTGINSTLEALTVLGLSQSASKSEIRKRYHELIKKFHPDQLGVDPSPEVFRAAEKRTAQLNEAYAYLLRNKTVASGE